MSTTPELKNVKRYTHAPAFLARMRQPTKVIFRFDVPDLSGTSKDRTTIFIDRSLKRYMRGKDVVQFLLQYEKAKIALKDLYGISHSQAHRIATELFEVPAVQFVGFTWNDYTAFMAPQIKSVKMVRMIPKELDISSYDAKEQVMLMDKYPKHETEQKRTKHVGDRDLHKGRVSRMQQRKAASNI